MVRFAFLGRVSTEDLQDPMASRQWQLSRAEALVAGCGRIVAEFFDVGESRSVSWLRRPASARLLAALEDLDRGLRLQRRRAQLRRLIGSQARIALCIDF